MSDAVDERATGTTRPAPTAQTSLVAPTQPTTEPPPMERWLGVEETWYETIGKTWREAREGLRRMRVWWRSPDTGVLTRTGRWFLVLRATRRGLARWRPVGRPVVGGVLADPVVRSRLRYLSVRRAARNAAQETYLACLVPVVFLLLFVVAPLYLMAPLPLSWPWQVAAMVGAFFVLALPVVAVSWFRARVELWVQLAVFATPGLGLVFTSGFGFGSGLRASALLENSIGDPAGFWLTVTLRLGAVSSLGLTIFLLLVTGYEVLLGYPLSIRRRPDEFAVEYLGRLAHALSSPPRDLASPRRRQAMACTLEALADVVENGFAAALRLPSADSNAELRERLRRIAAGIRGQQVAVAAPEVDTLARLQRVVVACLGAVCTGRLGSLSALVDAEPKPVRRRILGAFSWLRSIVIAIVPLTLVVALTDRGLLEPGGVDRAAMVAAVVWGLAVLLMAMDPQFNTRIQAVRDLMSALRGGDQRSD